MNKLLRCIGICLGAVFAFGAAACGEGGDPPEKKLQPAPEHSLNFHIPPRAYAPPIRPTGVIDLPAQ